MANRSADWLGQARDDLEHARVSRSSGHHNWASFASQQAAEKALKALYFSRNMEGWGHAVRKLLLAIADELPISEELVRRASHLDKAYILTRYPNGFAAGKPTDYYDDAEAAEAIADAEAILRFCEDHLGPAGGGGGRA